MNLTVRVLGVELFTVSLWRDAEPVAEPEVSRSIGFACADLAAAPPRPLGPEEIWR